MGLLERIFAIGGKLKIVQVTPAETPKVPQKIATRTIDLKDLAAEIQAQEVKALADQPEELAVPFEKVFETAGLKAMASGWTIERLRDLLRTEPYRSMDHPAAQKALVEHLQTQKVSAEDLVKDAMARDKALDIFEEVTSQRLRHRQEARQREAAHLQAQIETLRRQCVQLEEEGKAELAQWRAWHSRKIDFEKEMAWAIGYLLDRPVVTVDTDHV